MKLSNSLGHSLKKDDLENMVVGLGEVALDNLIDTGLWRDIPVLSTLLSGIKTVGNIRDALFIKKIIFFLSELSDISPKKRQAMIEAIDNSSEFQLKVGEKLTYIIERSEDHYSSKIIAIFFSAFINEEISYTQFLKISRIIDNMCINEFLDFAKSRDDSFTFESDNTYLNTGLVDIYFENVIVEDNDDYKIHQKYMTSGGASLYVTEIGKLVRRVLNNKC